MNSEIFLDVYEFYNKIRTLNCDEHVKENLYRKVVSYPVCRDFLEKLIEKFPNDQELGEVVRHLFRKNPES